MQPAASLYRLFEKHVPDNTVHYCYDLWASHKFYLNLKQKRRTKLGDYSYKSSQHFITINANLNRYSFLITYLHEVAHLITFKEFDRRVAPHGKQWKKAFALLLQPVTNELVFPGELLPALKKHLANPRATTCSDPGLMRILQSYDPGPDKIYLSDIEPGTNFQLRKRVFVKEKVKRTRSVCREIYSGTKYLISENAEITLFG